MSAASRFKGTFGLCYHATVYLTLLCGCAPREQPTISSQPAQKPPVHQQSTTFTSSQPIRNPGLVYVFPGIEGNPIWLADARRGYRDAGLTAEIRQFDWGRPLNMLANLTDLDENREKAAAVAIELAHWRDSHPQDPLDLVGYSGGGGMALLTLERLPREVRVRNVVLIQPAVGPAYSLDAALERIDGRLTNFYSPGDRFILGWGTTTFGNSDRTYGPAAGKIGFDLTAAVSSPDLRGKVDQIAWCTAWREAGHFGNHVGMLNYRWNREFVAPAAMAE